MRRFLQAGILACCLAATSAFAADLKLGYIDMQRALNASEAGIPGARPPPARAPRKSSFALMNPIFAQHSIASGDDTVSRSRRA